MKGNYLIPDEKAGKATLTLNRPRALNAQGGYQ
jgi:enoyl-CoA hydratase/carnithine racemase